MLRMVCGSVGLERRAKGVGEHGRVHALARLVTGLQRSAQRYRVTAWQRWEVLGFIFPAAKIQKASE
jgi:hypothetical protein